MPATQTIRGWRSAPASHGGGVTGEKGEAAAIQGRRERPASPGASLYFIRGQPLAERTLGVIPSFYRIFWPQELLTTAHEDEYHGGLEGVPGLPGVCPRACAPQQEKPPQKDAHAQLKSNPRSPQLQSNKAIFFYLNQSSFRDLNLHQHTKKELSVSSPLI